MKKHCKTCRCGKKEARHTCRKCHTKKYERFMHEVGSVNAFGWKPIWECNDAARCATNTNYK